MVVLPPLVHLHVHHGRRQRPPCQSPRLHLLQEGQCQSQRKMIRQKNRKPQMKDKEKGKGVLEEDREPFSADTLTADNAKKSPNPLRIIVGTAIVYY